MNINDLHQKIIEKQKELNDLLNDLNEQICLDKGRYGDLSIPEGATHYRIINSKVQYLKKLAYHDTWYQWCNLKKDWMITVWTRVEVGINIKPLNTQ